MAITTNPYSYLKDICERCLEEALKELPEFEKVVKRIIVDRPRDTKIADFASPVAFMIAKQLKKKPNDVANEIAEKIDINKFPIIEKVQVVNGYINFTLNAGVVSGVVISQIEELDTEFGKGDTLKGKKIVVEHTSANPIHPLHIGSARNSVYGDTLARLFKAHGANVKTHYYVNDTGYQVGVTTYGFSKVKDVKRDMKSDHWIGAIYAVTNTLKEINESVSKVTDYRTKLINISIDFEKRLDKVFETLRNVEETTKEYEDFLGKMESLYDSIIQDLFIVKNSANWIFILEELKTKIETTMEKMLTDELLQKYSPLNDLKQALKFFLLGNNDTPGLVLIIQELNKIRDILEVEQELRVKYPHLYVILEKEIIKDDDPAREIKELIKEYEKHKEPAKELFREVCNISLDGFKVSLSKLNIYFDSFDFESDLVFGGYSDRVIKELERTGYLIKEAPPSRAIIVDIQRACLEREDVRKLFGLTLKDIENAKKKNRLNKVLPPQLVLKRRDGTTLYPLNDIAYTLWKFEQGYDRVYNIIAAEQSMEQKQVAAALLLMGYEEYVKNFTHIGYGLVHLSGISMSGRKGRYVTLDELIDSAFLRAKIEINRLLSERNRLFKKKEKLDMEAMKDIIRAVAIGAIRFSLVNVAPQKDLVFDVKLTRAVKLDANTAPFVQYAHARACSILREAKSRGVELAIEKDVLELLSLPEEKELVLKLAEFPEKVISAINNLRPDIIGQYTLELAKAFSNFYSKVRVLGIENKKLELARLTLVDCVRITLRNALSILGIPAPERM